MWRMTRVLVCGGRDYADYHTVFEVLDGLHRGTGISVILEGGALGADRFARHWAQQRGVDYHTFEAEWHLGRSAGPIRNARMLAEGKPDLVIAFPGRKGTQNMVDQAFAARVPISRIEE